MSAEDFKAELDALLDKLQAGELKDTPLMIWWHKEATDEGIIYAQRMDAGDALALIAALTQTFKLNAMAVAASTRYYKLEEFAEGEEFLYRRLKGNGGLEL